MAAFISGAALGAFPEAPGRSAGPDLTVLPASALQASGTRRHRLDGLESLSELPVVEVSGRFAGPKC